MNITELIGMEQEVITLQDVFLFKQAGLDSVGRAYGEFEATGLASHYDPRFRAANITLPADFFRQRMLLKA